MYHRRTITTLLAAVLAVAGSGAIIGTAAAAPVTDPASLVNPLIGTANAGNTFPGAVTTY